MPVFVRTVVHDDVEEIVLVPEITFPELLAALIANKKLEVVRFDASRSDIDAVDDGPHAEILAPHLGAATVLNADLQNFRAPADEL